METCSIRDEPTGGATGRGCGAKVRLWLHERPGEDRRRDRPGHKGGRPQVRPTGIPRLGKDRGSFRARLHGGNGPWRKDRPGWSEVVHGDARKPAVISM